MATSGESAAPTPALRDRSRRSSPERDAQLRRRKIRRRIVVPLLIVLVVLLLAAAWVGFRALTVKNDLEAARTAVTSMTNGGDVATEISRVADHAESASAAAADPVWRVFEYVPVLGDNLRAVRAAAESLDVLGREVGEPAITAFAASDGAPVIPALVSIIDGAAPRVAQVADDVAAADASSFLIGPVRDAIDQVAPIMSGVGPTFRILPDMLGADGARNYLLVFQNSAEVMPLGGSAAAQSLVSVADGSITIAAQAGSRDYLNRTPPDVAVDQSAIDLYTDYLVRYTNTTTSRPDFPTAAQLLRAFWQRDIAPDAIDGVISITPKALGAVLKATGPVQIGDVSLSADNAEQLLLSDVYEWADGYTNPEVSDGFFAAATQEVFTRVASGQFDPIKMVDAVGGAIDGGDILMWSTDAEIQEVLLEGPIAGVLPTTNDEQTAVGVYFRDTSASKIDYYMNSAATVTGSCQDGRSSFQATGALRLDISQSAADDLPRYVKSFTWGSEQFRTEVFVYGPPGTTVESVSVDGRDVRELRTDIVDLGRPVASFEVFLAPEERASVTATFVGDGEFGPLDVRTTPMIRPTVVTAEGGGC